MAKGKAKQSVKETPEVEVKEEFQPEPVEGMEGAMRDEKKENPMDAVAEADAKKVRAPGNWTKVPHGQIAELEEKGLLQGYDPETGEVLIKEEKK